MRAASHNDQLFASPLYAELVLRYWPSCRAAPRRVELLRCIDFNIRRAGATRRLSVRFESSSRQRGKSEDVAKSLLTHLPGPRGGAAVRTVPIALNYVSAVSGRQVVVVMVVVVVSWNG